MIRKRHSRTPPFCKQGQSALPSRVLALQMPLYPQTSQRAAIWNRPIASGRICDRSSPLCGLSSLPTDVKVPVISETVVSCPDSPTAADLLQQLL
jgi:hypothetical protein